MGAGAVRPEETGTERMRETPVLFRIVVGGAYIDRDWLRKDTSSSRRKGGHKSRARQCRGLLEVGGCGWSGRVRMDARCPRIANTNTRAHRTSATVLWFPASELCVVCGLCGMLSVDLWSASILDARWSADLHILYDGMMEYGVSIMVSITITDMK